ncbi:hypothetical protein LCGC14_1062220 [marine sediment metagenome]|uniref:Uncharacterized protein n=1 Tax=marine sediment metagenome TaxID=412755 RepID=A0A0F9N7R1_9ZZZZ
MTNNKLEILFYERAKVTGRSTAYFLRWYNKSSQQIIWLEFMGLMESAYITKEDRS